MKNTSQKLKSLNITKPTFIIDLEKVKNNILQMKRKSQISKVHFRPHFKTHQSNSVGNLFREIGIKSITVSSLDMAEYFVRNGWYDITIAILVNQLEIEKINYLAKNIKLNLLVDSFNTINFLNKNLKNRVNVWIKIDTGYGRTGLLWSNFNEIISIANSINESSLMEFQGILSHFGQTYLSESKEAVKEIYFSSMNKLLSIKNKIENTTSVNCKISIGDTPSCSILEKFENVDEIRPGNFVFYDLMQMKIGSCNTDNIAVAVALPVIGKYKSRKQIVVYGGAVHLSKEFILDDEKRIFGKLITINNNSISEIIECANVISLSQEHGIIQLNSKLSEEIKVGDIVLIAPIHSCLTSNLYREFVSLDGEIYSKM